MSVMRIAAAATVLFSLATLAGCGTTAATTTLASSMPAPASTAPAAAKPSSASSSSTRCQGGPDLDVAISLDGGGWTGTTQSWCFARSGLTQVDIAQKTVASERFAGGWVECDIIALDSKNPQFEAWISGDQSRRPHLNGIIAEIGNC